MKQARFSWRVTLALVVLLVWLAVACGRHTVLAAAHGGAQGFGLPLSPACSNETCDYHNPYSEGCASGTYYVVSASPLQNFITGQASWSYGYIQLWWSAACQANWARVYVGETVTTSLIVFTYTSKPDNAGAGTSWPHATSGGAYYSPMLDAPDVLACGTVNLFDARGNLAYVGSTGQFSCPSYVT